MKAIIAVTIIATTFTAVFTGGVTGTFPLNQYIAEKRHANGNQYIDNCFVTMQIYNFFLTLPNLF